MAPRKIGRYEIKDVIGRGGMASVYLAYDPSSKRDVAVKVLPLESLGQEVNSLDRFMKELETIASLEHPAIVPVYDVGEENAQPFFVMRYMAGGSLSMLIEEGRFSLQDTARIIERIAVALDHAHKRNVIHRDIKPDNILFDLNDNPYISDFGVAKLTEVPGASNHESRVVGTPGYMSPEQAYDQHVDARSDVYGLGVVIFQMLSGKAIQRFSTNTSLDKVRAYVDQPIPEILQVVPDLPPAVDTIIKTAMARDKFDRYPTAIDLARALNQVAFGEDRLLDPSATLVDRPSILASSRRRIPVWLTVGILALIAIAGIFAFDGQIPFLSPASNPTPSLNPVSATISPTASPVPATLTPTPTATQTPAPTVIPMPGGADLIAIFSGNQIYLMNTDGSNLIRVRTDTSPKSNPQWIPGNRLAYMTRNCVFLLDAETNQTQQVTCFNPDEILEGFRVSPDGTLIAFTIQKTLNIVPFDLEALREVNTRFSLLTMQDFCFYNQYSFRDVLWSKDGKQLAARVVDTELINSDQIFLLNVNIEQCANIGPVRVDKFPGLHFGFSSESTKKITNYAWDGGHLFLLTDAIRNDGFGDLYLYDGQTQQEAVLNPIDGVCCYRDASWSPDGKYIIFVFQRFDSSEVGLYYIAYADLQSGKAFTPIELPEQFLLQREKPQPVLRPAQ
jgi:serine/threonine protein kinase